MCCKIPTFFTFLTLPLAAFATPIKLQLQRPLPAPLAHRDAPSHRRHSYDMGQGSDPRKGLCHPNRSLREPHMPIHLQTPPSATTRAAAPASATGTRCAVNRGWGGAWVYRDARTIGRSAGGVIYLCLAYRWLLETRFSTTSA
ncbi:hypothetical protein K432DRAFT_199098 [Lepidopterella palustris CBS 459.81]|uniref:Uncharacterized protein n=1 Tax=Lepidopterella palustris CBS 459.81 TaxID=1314670 RepID=A0A8E2EFP6_9PEZI|nr:hypothetical protein K432DRAFT_199098 [Lepidopterella palustris CBS 459.81]